MQKLYGWIHFGISGADGLLYRTDNKVENVSGTEWFKKALKGKYVITEPKMSAEENKYYEPIDFKLSEVDYSKYESIMYEKNSLASAASTKVTNIDYIRDKVQYSFFSLVGEIARYLNVSCILIERIIKESIDGDEVVLDRVNNYNEIVNDIIIPNIFHALYNIDIELHTADKEIVLLKEPKGAGYYEFLAEDKLVVTNQDKTFTPEQLEKSFHADTYCFDSVPEKDLKYHSPPKYWYVNIIHCIPLFWQLKI